MQRQCCFLFFADFRKNLVSEKVLPRICLWTLAISFDATNRFKAIGVAFKFDDRHWNQNC
jgi:hypothetical protein